MQFTSILELIIASFFSLISLVGSAGVDVPPLDGILGKLPWDFLSPYRPGLTKKLFSAFFACIFWLLFFLHNRVKPLSPDGFTELATATLAGPVMVLAWSIAGLAGKKIKLVSPRGIGRILSKWLINKRRENNRRRLLKWVTIKGPLVLAAGIFGIGGLLGITYGVIRPLENGIVVTCMQGLDKMAFEDELLLNLEHLENIHGLIPEYYDGEVHDRKMAKEIACIKNQRFIVWGNVRLEENEDFIATVFFRVTDVTEDVDVFSSDNYIVVAPSTTDIVNRVANDCTIITLWALGFASLGWQPTCDSIVRSSQIFAALSDKTLHENVPETKSLGLLLQDIGFLEMKNRLLQNKTTLLKVEESFLTAIAELDPTTSKSALAKLHNYYAEFLIESGLDSNTMNQKIKGHLQEVILLDNSYPMPHYNLLWIIQTPDESYEDAVWHACEFLTKTEEIYGQFLVEDGDSEASYGSNFLNERIKFVKEFLDDRGLIYDTETRQMKSAN